jgi:exo-beta-1,3-glucanase (GH17 family)
VKQYVQDFKTNGIMNIRTYSQECDQLKNILSAIDGSMTVTAAVWLDGSSQDDEEIKQLKSALNAANPSQRKHIQSIMVGNEVLFKGSVSSEALVSKMEQVKKVAQDIPVGTVDTPNTFTSSVIQACDVIGLNIHPYFASVDIDQAGANMVKQYKAFSPKAKGKELYVAETGWPSAGKTKGDAVPSVSNVQSYVKQLKKISDVKYYYFEAQDSNWKEGGNDGVETHFGLYDASGKSKVAL